MKKIIEKVLKQNNVYCMDNSRDRRHLTKKLLEAFNGGKVDIIVGLHNGLIEDVEVFISPEDAEKFIRQQLIKDCGLRIEDEEKELKTTDDLLNWLSDYLGEPHDNEIHWFTANIKQRSL